MTVNDKYKMFKNFMHNELGISKEDIREWVRESIKEEVKNIVTQAYGKCNIENEVRKAIKDNDLWSSDGRLKPEIYKLVCAEVGMRICDIMLKK